MKWFRQLLRIYSFDGTERDVDCPHLWSRAVTPPPPPPSITVPVANHRNTDRCSAFCKAPIWKTQLVAICHRCAALRHRAPRMRPPKTF